MREAFARDFPEVAALGRRLPTLSGSAPPWAALAAIGATYAVGTILRGVASSLGVATLSDAVGVYPWAEAFAIAAGTMVSRRAGDRRAFLLFLIYVALSSLSALAGAVLRAATCDPATDILCGRDDAVFAVVIGQWSVLLGLLLGVPLAHLLRRGRPGANAALEGAGAIGLGLLAVSIALVTFSTLMGPGLNSAQLVVAPAELLVFIAAGAVVGLRSRGRIRPALVLAGVSLATWIPLVGPQLEYFWLASATPTVPLVLLALLWRPVLAVVLLLTGIAVTRAASGSTSRAA